MQPVFFQRPEGTAITLRTAPRLSNWNRSGDSGGARLSRAMSYSQAQIDPALASSGGPVALRFDVGLPRTTRLLEERDLDNYLLPLTADLAARSAQPIVSVWGCKRYADTTTLRVETAKPRTGLDDAQTFTVTAAGSRDEFKADFRRQIRDHLVGQEQLPDGPVVLEIGYLIGPARNWLDLWWSTMDALGPLLGQSPAQPEFHSRDGRIADLGLHCSVEDDLGDDVVIALQATAGWLDPVPDS